MPHCAIHRNTKDTIVSLAFLLCRPCLQQKLCWLNHSIFDASPIHIHIQTSLCHVINLHLK